MKSVLIQQYISDRAPGDTLIQHSLTSLHFLHEYLTVSEESLWFYKTLDFRVMVSCICVMGRRQLTNTFHVLLEANAILRDIKSRQEGKTL